MRIMLALAAALLMIGCSSLCEDPCKKGERTLEASGPRAEKGLVEEAEGVLGDVGQAIEDAFDAALHFNFNRDVLGCDIPECHCKRGKK